MTFRFADENDCSVILSFIKALADYEKMTEQVAGQADVVCPERYSRFLSMSTGRRRKSVNVFSKTSYVSALGQNDSSP